MAINLRAPFLIAREAIAPMLARGFGRIVLLSSVAAYRGGFVGPHYAASKAGLQGLAHSLAQLGAGRDVTANVVAPALSAAIVRNGFLTSQSILLDGGLHPG